MGFAVFLTLVFAAWIGVPYFLDRLKQQEQLDSMTSHERFFGPLNEHLVCPHCQTKGLVRVRRMERTVTSIGKVGGILKTNTTSHTKAIVTQHHCDQCNSTWDI